VAGCDVYQRLEHKKLQAITPGQLRKIDFRVLTRDPDLTSIFIVLFPDESNKGRTMIMIDGQIVSWSNDSIEIMTYPIMEAE
jgi:hypothetical protein